jgi:serine/threonine protein kinase
MKPDQVTVDEHPLDQLLADLDADAAVTTDSTVRQLHAELVTLADELRQPPPTDSYQHEPACRRSVEQAVAIGRDLLPSRDLAAEAGPPALSTIGPYRLLAKLGQGGMGTVYKALHTRLEKVVAVKVLPADRLKDASALARFEREMKAIGKIDHPHLVRALDAGEAGGTHYLVMEHVAGIDLAELLKRTGPLPVTTACELIRQAALGLEAAHGRGMVHRDVKPGNLMLAAQEFGPPVVKVLDLGLALLSGTQADAGALTSTGHIMGTIDYMAPEQANDSHAVDIRADVYSLGATLYALLTGGSIFHGRSQKTFMQKLAALATESAPPIRDRRSDVPAALAAIVHRMLARNPDERFATPAEVAAALAPFAAGADLATLLHAAPVELGTVSWDSRKLLAPDTAENSPQCAVSTQKDVSIRTRRASAASIRRIGLLAAGVLLVLVAAGLLIAYWPPGRPAVNQGPGAPPANDPNASPPSILPSDSGADILPSRGDLDILIYESAREAKADQFMAGNLSRQNLRLHHAGALPLTPRDWIRIEATLDQPAYLYVIWIDTAGIATPLFPWPDSDWKRHPDREAARKALSIPSETGIAPLSEGPAGVETVLLLARARPLDSAEYAALPDRFPKQARQSVASRQPHFAVWLENGEREVEKTRGAIRPQIVAQVDDPEVQARELMKNVKHLFPYSRAVLFGNTGKK